jgi:hypothetical protein
VRLAHWAVFIARRLPCRPVDPMTPRNILSFAALDYVAARIREIAEKNNIPVIE